MVQKDLKDLTYPDLEKEVALMGERPFRAAQVFEWLYRKGVRSFDQMKNMPRSFREELAQKFTLEFFSVGDKQVARDGTTKFLFELGDQQRIETVLIPVKTRTTACLSTQAGCKFGCKFCASGVGGWVRDLSVAEIITQALQVKEEAQRHEKPLSHIVFMGVGEPLDNYDHLLIVIRIINEKRGLNIGARRITISTCGLVPEMEKLSREGLQVELAISLHASNDALRNELMPINKKYPLKELMAACRAYYRQTNRQITFEYILIKDVTCTEKAVKELRNLFKGFDAKMNLIRYNEVKEFPYQTPSHREIAAFQESLKAAGVHSVLRTPRGEDIAAACGQLRNN